MKRARATAVGVLGAATLLLASACGARSGLRADRGEPGGDGSSPATFGGAGGGAAGATPGGAGQAGTAGKAAGGAGAAGASGSPTAGSGGTGQPAFCFDFTPETETAAGLDVFLLLDTSGSMNEATSAGVKKLGAVQAALATFFGNAQWKGARAAILRFPFPEPLSSCEKASDCPDGECATSGTCENDPKTTCFTTLQCGGAPCVNKAYCQFSSDMCSTNADCPPGTGECWFGGSCTTQKTCDPAAYETPIVELSSFGSPALVAGLDSLTAEGPTPTLPAYGGASTLARASAKQTSVPTIVVLVSDGMPSLCGSPSPVDDAVVGAKLAKVATATLADGVTTHALGIFSKKEQAVAMPSLEAFAKAGGGGAFVIAPDGGLSASFVAAMDAIAKSAVSCTYHLPDLGGKVPDPASVKVTIAGKELTHVAGPAACTGDGFYLSSDLAEDAVADVVLLCPEACTTQPVKLGVVVQGDCVGE